MDDDLDDVAACMCGCIRSLQITYAAVQASACALEGPRRTTCLQLGEQLADALATAERLAVCISGDMRYQASLTAWGAR